MPSSTSSSERPVPSGNWVVRAWVAILLALAVLGAWEARCRDLGYAPTLNDTSDLWCANRDELRGSPERTVAIGSSRIQFDLDLDVFAEYFGTERPVQLAIPGSTPLPILEHLAADESFRGDVVCGIVPGLFFVPQGMPVERSQAVIHRYENWAPSQRTGSWLGIRLQRRFALIEQEDLTLNALLRSLRVPNREGTAGHLPPELPPYFASVEESRQARMWEKCTPGSPLALRIQQIWVPLFTPPPPPPMFTPEEFGAMYMASVQSYLERTRESVAAIRERGGRVVFVRCPSTGRLREMENQFSPRQGFWERILAETGAPGIHFEDYPELSGFDCPEWSHLEAADAVRFTRGLMPLLTAALDRHEGSTAGDR